MYPAEPDEAYEVIVRSHVVCITQVVVCSSHLVDIGTVRREILVQPQSE